MGDTSNSVYPEFLISCLGTPDCPLIFDVRREQAYADAADIIPSADWRDHETCDHWGRHLPKDSEIMVYCVHGHEVSQGAAATLSALGLSVRYLAGGIEGYREAGGRLIPKPNPECA